MFGLNQLYTSPPEFHKHYITAMACIFRKTQNQILLISGDASGDVAVAELSYSNLNHKLEEVNLLYRRRAHKAGVSQIELTGSDDVFVTASQDGSIA